MTARPTFTIHSPMVSEPLSDLEALRSSLLVARKQHALCGSPRPATGGTPTKPVVIPPIALTIPCEITQSLIDRGFTAAVAQSLSHAFIQSAHRIRARFDSLYRETCQKWITRRLDTSISGLGPIIELQYKNQLCIAEKLVVDRGHALSQCRQSVQPSRSKPAFNQVSSLFFDTPSVLNSPIRNLYPFLRNISNTTHIPQR